MTRLPRISALLLGVLFTASASSAESVDPLEWKADRFREAIMERHLSREGLLLYRVNLETIEEDLRSGRYPHMADLPTFTGQLAAAACTRAGVETGTRREQARADAAHALDGLRLLMDVTGSPGLLARSVQRDAALEAAPSRGKWLPGVGSLSNFRWRADVSMDQYANGLLPAAAACSGLFPERARRLVGEAADHLLSHGMRLVDPDGVATRYGDLSAFSGLGFNSIALLTGYTIFALAAELDPDPEWTLQRDRLRDHYRVVARARRTNLRLLGITNFSNDLMAWNLYRVLVPLARRTGDPALADLRHGMTRTRLRTRQDRNAYFDLIHCRVEPASCEAATLRDARETLAHFPMEKRLLPARPELEALPRRWLPGRKLRARARDLVPIELRPASSFEWKSSPYRVEGATMPGWSYCGVDYLAAYWLYRSITSERVTQGRVRAAGAGARR